MTACRRCGRPVWWVRTPGWPGAPLLDIDPDPHPEGTVRLTARHQDGFYGAVRLDRRSAWREHAEGTPMRLTHAMTCPELNLGWTWPGWRPSTWRMGDNGPVNEPAGHR